MISVTPYSISQKLLIEAQEELPNVDHRLILNQPTGEFFYDPWEIKPDFKNTIWEDILNSIAEPVGEARLIKLMPGECYPSHCDIDDRWHLALVGNHCYFLDLESKQFYQTPADGKWHTINTGIKHSAGNFGYDPRIQLVVRQLLKRPTIVDPIKVSIKLKDVVYNKRFLFDDIISPWLNKANKLGIIDNFVGTEFEVLLTIASASLDDLISTVNEHFAVTIL